MYESNHTPVAETSAELSQLGNELHYFHASRVKLAARLEALRRDVAELSARSDWLARKTEADPGRIARAIDELESETTDAVREVERVRRAIIGEGA